MVDITVYTNVRPWDINAFLLPNWLIYQSVYHPTAHLVIAFPICYTKSYRSEPLCHTFCIAIFEKLIIDNTIIISNFWDTNNISSKYV